MVDQGPHHVAGYEQGVPSGVYPIVRDATLISYEHCGDARFDDATLYVTTALAVVGGGRGGFGIFASLGRAALAVIAGWIYGNIAPNVSSACRLLK